MKLREAKELYLYAGGPDDHDEKEWEEIRQEMELVVAAKGPRVAARIIDFWGCWGPRFTATRFARRVRERWQEMQKEAKQ